ncbi:hypothetical protein F4677DRAFT_185099 [Hypoxylon crocopeplum]|nr:hypothetical protein F4677DRAFT_185099 [Hypoxylon crocopeplum]
MPQTMYNRPWPSWVILAVTIPLTALLVAMGITQGVHSLATWIVLLVDVLALITLSILDPEVTIESRKVLPDGNAVTVRRPIVGFKKCERIVGVTGGYEVRVDGFRYEEAYIRI